MRVSTIAATLTFAGLLAACSGHRAEKAEKEAANNPVAPAGFVPPTALNRTDFVDLLDKRFTQLDLNHDSILEASEVPSRHHDRIMAADANHDGRITLDEFQKQGLAHFDEADKNQDQVLTGDERRATIADGLGNDNAAAAGNEAAANAN